jgi:excisionase family DNA binding protein
MRQMLTVDDAAGLLMVEPAQVLGLISSGNLRAFRIAGHLRVREDELEEYVESCACEASESEPRETASEQPHQASPEISGSLRNAGGCSAIGSSVFRDLHTRTGRGHVKVAGGVADGASILMGDMRYPLRFPAEFFQDLLRHFGGQEVRTGTIFTGEKGSLGDWIQKKANTRMNPTYAIAALLVDEGYAEWAERGYIRILERRRVPRPTDAGARARPPTG